MLDIIAIREQINVDNHIGISGHVYNAKITKIIKVFNDEDVEVEITFSDGSATNMNSKDIYVLE